MTIHCPSCQKTKRTRDFIINSRAPDVLRDVCIQCHQMPRQELAALREKVKASTVSKMQGHYTPAPWNIRNGADAFLRIPSRRLT